MDISKVFLIYRPSIEFEITRFDCLTDKGQGHANLSNLWIQSQLMEQQHSIHCKLAKDLVINSLTRTNPQFKNGKALFILKWIRKNKMCQILSVFDYPWTTWYSYLKLMSKNKNITWINVWCKTSILFTSSFFMCKWTIKQWQFLGAS